MIGRKAVVGMALLSALVFSAFAAQSASAVTTGRTAWTCKEEPKPVKVRAHSDAHCTTQVGEGLFSHVEIEEKKTTDTHITSAKTDPTTTKDTSGTLKVTALGVENEIHCAKTFGHAKLTNKKEGSEHFIHAEKVTLHYTECEVKKPNKCELPNKTVLVEGVTGRTNGEAASMTFKPEVGNVFVTLKYENCENKFLNGEHKVEGEVTGKLNGATIEFNHEEVTKQGKLKFFGAAAGIEGKVTVSKAASTAELGKTPGATESPISSTPANT
jgi:hypothetical protein